MIRAGEARWFWAKEERKNGQEHIPILDLSHELVTHISAQNTCGQFAQGRQLEIANSDDTWLEKGDGSEEKKRERMGKSIYLFAACTSNTHISPERAQHLPRADKMISPDDTGTERMRGELFLSKRREKEWASAYLFVAHTSNAHIGQEHMQTVCPEQTTWNCKFRWYMVGEGRWLWSREERKKGQVYTHVSSWAMY